MNDGNTYVFVIGVFGDVVLVGQERTNAAELEDAIAAVHDSKLILGHQIPKLHGQKAGMFFREWVRRHASSTPAHTFIGLLY